MRDNDIVRVCYPVDFHEERGLKRAGKLLVSKVTKLRQNFDLILLRLINKIASSKLTVKLKSLKP